MYLGSTLKEKGRKKNSRAIKGKGREGGGTSARKKKSELLKKQRQRYHGETRTGKEGGEEREKANGL